MEGRYPSGITFVMTNCPDPSKEDEYNYWFNHIHIPDVTAPGVFGHGTRYVNTSPKPGEGQYLVTYETDWEDVAAARAAQSENSARNRERGRSYPNPHVVLVGGFKRLGGEFSAANRPMRGILAVLVNCEDPAREEDFHRYYEDVHIPDILDSGLYHRAYRYESIDPQATGGKYLAIFETDHDPGKAGDELRKLRGHWSEQGRSFDGLEIVFRITARRIWPTD